jgi:hypothetical protein
MEHYLPGDATAHYFWLRCVVWHYRILRWQRSPHPEQQTLNPLKARAFALAALAPQRFDIACGFRAAWREL